jgi:RHS repeat-associated protein
VRYVRDYLNGSTSNGGDHWVEIEVYGSRTVAYLGNYYERDASSSTPTRYYYAGAERVAMRTGTGSGTTGLEWLLDDQLGSTTITADGATGAKLSELRYKAWGEDRYTSGTAPTSYRFTGQRVDSYINLYWYNSRWYDQTLGRFIQPDSIVPGVGESGNLDAVGYLGTANYSALTVDYHENQLLDQLNTENRARFQDSEFKLPPVPTNSIAFDRYAYSLDNPVRYTDPSGHCPFCVPIILTLGAVTPVGWVAIGVTAIGAGLYFAVPGVREAVTAGFEQAGEAVSDAASATANGLAAISQTNQLPKTGDFPYVPPKQKGNPPYVRAPQGGFKDANGNIWRRDKSAHGGPHWDVEHPDGSHTNVDDTGKIIRKKK